MKPTLPCVKSGVGSGLPQSQHLQWARPREGLEPVARVAVLRLDA